MMAVTTGLWLYTIALRNDRPSSLAIWLHVVTSVLALALVTYKVAESGRARLARGLDPARFLTDGLSLMLAALAVPCAHGRRAALAGLELGDRLRAPRRQRLVDDVVRRPPHALPRAARWTPPCAAGRAD